MAGTAGSWTGRRGGSQRQVGSGRPSGGRRQRLTPAGRLAGASARPTSASHGCRALDIGLDLTESAPAAAPLSRAPLARHAGGGLEWLNAYALCQFAPGLAALIHWLAVWQLAQALPHPPRTALLSTRAPRPPLARCTAPASLLLPRWLSPAAWCAAEGGGGGAFPSRLAVGPASQLAGPRRPRAGTCAPPASAMPGPDRPASAWGLGT